MSQPPPGKSADAGMEKLFSRLPGLIDQARKGTMQQQAIAQLRLLLKDRRPAIEAWYKANNMPSPFASLPASINPAIPPSATSTTESPRASPAPNAGSPAAITGPTANASAVRPTPRAPGTMAPQRPAGQVTAQPRPALQPTAPPLARPLAGTTTTTGTARPPGAANPSVRPSAAGARPPAATATNSPSPGSALGGNTSRAGTPSVTSWTDVFNMTAEQRRAWFDAVPGSEATYNKILEDARKKHMAMRQGDGQGSRQGSPVSTGPGSRGNSPAPTGGPGSPAAAPGGAVRPIAGQTSVRPPTGVAQGTTAAGAATAQAQGQGASGTRAIRPVNQGMPLPNLAIPAGARRGSTTGDGATAGAAAGTTATTTTTASSATAPENRPPAGIHSLSQDKIRFYMSLSDAQGQVLPHDQKQLWLWLKKLIQETKQQSANKQATQGQQRLGPGGAKVGMPQAPGTQGYSGFRMPNVPGGLSMGNLNEEILKLYTDGRAPTLQQLRELCIRGGLNWSVQLENLVAPYASDRAKHASGMKLDPIEIPPTPMGGPPPVVPRTAKEHLHENVRKVVEHEIGNIVDDDLVTIFQDLAGDLFQEVIAGGIGLARVRKEDRALNVRDVAQIARQAVGITIPGFGLEQSQIGKRKALPSRMNERHLKKLRAVQRAKDREAGRIS
ncbi:hypothetical protein NliqN6_1202 [Naganishia liquefaciens]|uniref:Uncharacterized protein n=1 Tax=Naganishia liquefaciens TaxID=104408 RepID=A0A8H3TPG6_9TREE|nr:hypothetical protein NliqN6_1202 [Naganishia liquefaciens]